MANKTHIKSITQYTVYQEVEASGDLPTANVTTNDSVAQNMDGEGSAELHASSTAITHVAASKVQDTTEAAIAGSTSITKYLYIKNTGYTTSGKTVATTSTLTVGCGGEFANGGFTLSAGEAICLHGLGGGSDNLAEWYLDSSSGDIYVEIKYF